MKRIKINLAAIILSLALFGMYAYISFDAIVVKPEFNQTIKKVVHNFDTLTFFLNNKLPEVDSALYIHTNQIADQNKQLEELNKLTAILKEE